MVVNGDRQTFLLDLAVDFVEKGVLHTAQILCKLRIRRAIMGSGNYGNFMGSGMQMNVE